MVTVEFGGRVVNADGGSPVGSVRVSLHTLRLTGSGLSTAEGYAKDIAMSCGYGAFTLPLNVPVGWRSVYFQLTAPLGYKRWPRTFKPDTAADRPAIRMYPTLVIRPGESTKVRVDGNILWCGWDGLARRVLVAASPGDTVELEVVPDDSTKPMALDRRSVPFLAAGATFR